MTDEEKRNVKSTDLHKILEEIAIEMYPVHIGDYFCGGKICKNGDTNLQTRETLIEGGTIGYALGYKAAIKVAKEWLNRHIGVFHPKMDDLRLVSDKDGIYFDGNELLADLEKDMNEFLGVETDEEMVEVSAERGDDFF